MLFRSHLLSAAGESPRRCTASKIDDFQSSIWGARAPSRQALPGLVGTRARRVATSSISLASVRNTKASSFRCGSLPNQSRGFDLERKNGGADTEPSRFRAAAAWSKPILTTPQGDFPPHMSPENQLDRIRGIRAANSARLFDKLNRAAAFCGSPVFLTARTFPCIRHTPR